MSDNLIQTEDSGSISSKQPLLQSRLEHQPDDERPQEEISETKKLDQDVFNGNDSLTKENLENDANTSLDEPCEYRCIDSDDISNQNVDEDATNLTSEALETMSKSLENGIDLAWDSEFSGVDKTSTSPEPTTDNIHYDAQNTSWRKLSDGGGTYYWNIETGVTQYDIPEDLNINKEESDLESFKMESIDSSLADLEGAAFRYASLTIGNDDSLSDSSNSKWAGDSDSGRMFSVRSLGWLPLDNCSTDPATSSADVNACIRHLSKSHGQIMDGIGAWGEGKNLLLLIDDEYLKLLDPLSQTVLQTQVIRHIRVWGVGRDNVHDFAYVAKDSLSKSYKCHVFRCDASAKAIARELHHVCENLSVKHKRTSDKDIEREKEKVAMATPIPAPKTDPGKSFPIKYLGHRNVAAVNGIHTVKNVIRDITTDDSALCQSAVANVTANALTITSNQAGENVTLVNCRMRCLSFMGIGDDISLFAFISVMASEAVCHVLQCEPNAAKLGLAVQEACMLRFQKAVDSNQTEEAPPPETPTRSPVRRFIKRVFSLKKKSQPTD
uniref:Amyloid beta A4 protein-binding family B member 2-like n=1 Tax=Phallusia mammillata TaxID=59560 RepID=A0A6F9D734_9ASCI|nr:amyloid beta A4 precursor protein-binding family B member 2-like [Phallusia mammillata]